MEKGITIAGEELEIPSVDSFNLDEAEILARNAGITVEDIVLGEEADLRKKIFDPGFIRTMSHVAYGRAHPEVSAAEIDRLVGQENWFRLQAEYLDAVASLEQEDDARPPAQSESSSEGSESVASGNGSSNGSEEPADRPAITTTPGSGTSAVSGRVTWESSGRPT